MFSQMVETLISYSIGCTPNRFSNGILCRSSLLTEVPSFSHSSSCIIFLQGNDSICKVWSRENILLHLQKKTRPHRWRNHQNKLGVAYRRSSTVFSEVILWPRALCSKRPYWTCSIVQHSIDLELITQVKYYMDQQLLDVQWSPSQDENITLLDPHAVYLSQR